MARHTNQASYASNHTVPDRCHGHHEGATVHIQFDSYFNNSTRHSLLQYYIRADRCHACHRCFALFPTQSITQSFALWCGFCRKAAFHPHFFWYRRASNRTSDGDVQSVTLEGTFSVLLVHYSYCLRSEPCCRVTRLV